MARNGATNNPAAQPPWFRLVPEDGWLTIALVALMVYVTVFSIQSVTPPWAPGLGILATVTSVGLLLAYISVQQGRLPGLLVHTLALSLGIVFAFLQTSDAVLDGDRRALFVHIGLWLQHALLGNGQSDDNTIFLLFLAILTMLLAYISLWLVVRTRRPWLAVLANGVVLLINLNWSTPDHYFYLALFLLMALLMLVRFTLAENMRRWRAKGLRFSPDLSWDVMQTGAIFAVLVLLVSYNLPVGAANPAIVNALTSPNSPVTGLESRLQQLFGGVTGNGTGPGVSFFSQSLRLVGTVHLPDQEILHYTVPSNLDDPGQYLVTETFDTYDGSSLWTQSLAQQTPYQPNQVEPAPSGFESIDHYNLTFDRVPIGGETYLFAPGVVPASFSVKVNALVSENAGVPTSWQATQPLVAGASYNAEGYISTATVAQLQKVPYPSQGGSTLYPSPMLDEYLPANSGYIAKAVSDTATLWTKGATNMYDAATQIEAHLRTFTYSTTNPNPPGDQDAVSYFLQTKKGFCTYFASAMALMGRALHMPTRVVSGFTSGQFDDKSRTFVVKGTAAHTWTQIYFGQYGWINFEPTQTFAQFFRPTSGIGGPTPSATTGPVVTPTPNQHFQHQNGDNGPNGTSNTTNPAGTAIIDVGLALAAAAFLVLLLTAIFLVWWRLLYRKLTPAAATLARLTRLGAWAGAPPRRQNTPDEYVERLSTLVPSQRDALTEVVDVYDRERWGGGAPPGSSRTLPTLYRRLRVALIPLIASRARRLPRALLRRARSLTRRS
jgi:transglutaminase-like putative cysteine protease